MANELHRVCWSGVHGFTDDFFVDKERPRIEVDIFEVK